MKRLQAAFPLLVVAVLAAASFWLESIVRTGRPIAGATVPTDPDALIDNFQLVRHAPEGHPQFTLRAKHAKHFPHDDSAYIVAPRVQFRDQAQAMEWTADEAHLADGARIVTLRGNVIGMRAATTSTPAQQLTTSRLTLLTDDEIARTDAPITLLQGNSRADGVGAEWHNLEGRLLMNKVRATLAPNTTP